MKRLFALAAAMVLASPAAAEDLFARGNWSSMASDRNAAAPGDIVTVLIYENAVATNTAQNGSRKNTKVQGQISAGSDNALNESAQLGFGGQFDGAGQTGRSGKMVAQISATVESVLPNGDLRIVGGQNLNINGEHSFIRLRGRIRAADVRDNAVISSRIADAEIDYGGTGFVSRSAKPGFITRIFNFLGIM
jgi:flagellar L-ring protein precursor FlgH